MKVLKEVLKELGLIGGMTLLLFGWLLMLAALSSLAPLLGIGWLVITAAALVELGRMEVGPLW